MNIKLKYNLLHLNYNCFVIEIMTTLNTYVKVWSPDKRTEQDIRLARD